MNNENKIFLSLFVYSTEKRMTKISSVRQVKGSETTINLFINVSLQQKEEEEEEANSVKMRISEISFILENY